MLNTANIVITKLVFDISKTDPWAVRAHFRHLSTGKTSEKVFEGRDQYMQVAEQCRAQIKTNDLVTVTSAAKSA